MKTNKHNRRKFLRNSSLGILGAGLLGEKGFSQSQSEKKYELPKIKEYRMLGRTGFKVSDIGCGPAILANENVLKALLKAGVNYIDSAEAYGRRVEILIGKAIKDFDRKTIFVTSKVWLTGKESKDDIIKQFRGTLERMGTDYIDCLQMHSVTSSKDLNYNPYHEAVVQLKNEGHLKFSGVSCHGANWFHNPEETMEEILNTAIVDGRFDVLLLVYNFVQVEMGEKILRLCREKNIGTTLMKTEPFGGFYLTQLQRYNEHIEEDKEIPDYLQTIYDKFKEKQEKAKPFIEKFNLNNDAAIRNASIRFVLNNMDAHSTLISFRGFQDIENYLSLSGQKFSDTDLAILGYSKTLYGDLYCRHACSICESVCPSQVSINTIMRYHYYFINQNREKYAMQQYQKLPGSKPDVCENCPGYCEQACPYGVSTRGLIAIAHETLNFYNA